MFWDSGKILRKGFRGASWWWSATKQLWLSVLWQRSLRRSRNLNHQSQNQWWGWLSSDSLRRLTLRSWLHALSNIQRRTETVRSICAWQWLLADWFWCQVADLPDDIQPPARQHRALHLGIAEKIAAETEVYRLQSGNLRLLRDVRSEVFSYTQILITTPTKLY